MELSNGYSIITEDCAYTGVKKIADKVVKDIYLVTDRPAVAYEENAACENLIIYGTVGRSEWLTRLENEKKIDLTLVRGKWEVYGFFVIEHPVPNVRHALVIAGSDKRGTIYGLFHLSEILGVSPLVNWNHVMPAKKNVVLTKAQNYISKEPSVQYRGFFINDEWPAFGNWATVHFGGINAKCYENVFELLLRLKGNYLWPAMWRSNFNLDGPGLESAELADEYGVVMSTSHHEPCMRAGEEFNLFKGEDSIYGNAWNFRTNREGITRFWKDGLVRNSRFENVITMGMRGERDSAILGKDAGLKANIDLLRDVLRTQNQLIRETVCEDLDQVPRQIVLFTEVEEFFYGDEKTEGLFGDPELEGVTLMLSDNNFGYTRTLPNEKMRGHKGGYGMYYHMDMHGGAYSYQWIGSTYLPRVWEQMTQAYEFGVKKIWVTNIGDIGTQEYGLSFFLDLAYDIEKWGGMDAAITEKYTTEWVNQQFTGSFSEADRQLIGEMMWQYTTLLAKRKHEIMNADIYHPLHFGEADEVLRISEELLKNAEALKAKCTRKHMSAFLSLLYYPVCGTANLMKMWILAGRNKLFAAQNRIETNELIGAVRECLKRDRELIEEYEAIDDGYYKGFGDSEHIGFVNWNDEDCKYPVFHEIIPAKEPRMLLSRITDEHYMTGTIWCDHPQTWEDFLRPDVHSITFELSNASDKPYYFEIVSDENLLHFTQTGGKVEQKERITVSLDKADVIDERELYFRALAYTDAKKENCFADAKVTIKVSDQTYDGYEKGTFVENEGFISMRADHYLTEKAVGEIGFRKLMPYGRSGAAMKVYPVTADFLENAERPYLEYAFVAKHTGQYHLRFYLSPSTPVCFERKQYMGFSVNAGEVQIVNTVKNEAIPFFLSAQWEEEAKSSTKIVESEVDLREGENRLRFYGMSPGIVPEKIVLWNANQTLPQSYLGPKESYRV